MAPIYLFTIKFQITGISLINGELKRHEKRTIFKPDAKIGEIPAFVRIDTISLDSFSASIIDVLPLLKHFSSTFVQTPFVHLYSFISEFLPECFRSHTQVLFCLGEKMLQIFDGRTPHFLFCFYCDDPRDRIPLVDSILKLPEVHASSSVRFFIVGQLINPHMPHSLQIDGISNWLHREYVEPPAKFYRTLKIESDQEEMLLVRVNSVQRLIETLKAVSRIKNNIFWDNFWEKIFWDNF